MNPIVKVLAVAVLLVVLMATTVSPLSPPITIGAMAGSASIIAVIVELDRADRINGGVSAPPKGNY